MQENSWHLEKFFGRSYQDIKNGINNSCFVKIKFFRLQMSKLLRKWRNTYILDVICNRFYFWEVQEEVLGECNRQGISAPIKEGMSVYQWSVQEKKSMQGSWGNAFTNTSLRFLGLSWKFWKNWSSLQV